MCGLNVQRACGMCSDVVKCSQCYLECMHKAWTSDCTWACVWVVYGQICRSLAPEHPSDGERWRKRHMHTGVRRRCLSTYILHAPWHHFEVCQPWSDACKLLTPLFLPQIPSKHDTHADTHARTHTHTRKQNHSSSVTAGHTSPCSAFVACKRSFVSWYVLYTLK